MRKLKIILAIVVVGLITFFIIKSYEPPVVPPIGSEAENEFTKVIDAKITELKNLPNNKFGQESYMNVSSLINDYSKPDPPKYTYGRLGETQFDNDKLKDNLTRNLYAAYVDKFLDQAFYVFNNSVWSPEDLAFIRSEYRSLRSSPYLQSGSPVDNRLGDIQRIFNKYDEVNDFISTCNGFSFPKPSSSLGTEDYNYIEPIRGLLDQVNTYRQNLLSNTYLRNCTRLQTNVNSVPQSLFQKHVQYLDERITQWSGLYTEVNTQIMYRNTLYDPLNAEIAEVDSDLYGNTISTTDDERRRLLGKWNEDASLAYTHIEKKQKKIKNEDN